MFSALSFRKKIILSQIVLFLVFFAALFPFVEKMAPLLVRDSLIESTRDLKDLLQKTTTEEELIKTLEDQSYYTFFRMSLLNDADFVIYDTYLQKQLGDRFTPYSVADKAEIAEARRTGQGYVIAFSDTFHKQFAYVAQAFPFQGKQYILRTSFPYEQIQDLTHSFEIGVLLFSCAILLFFNAIIWTSFARLTRPIGEITAAITPYQKGEQEELPEIRLSTLKAPSDEFQKLASTLNRLSKRIHEQIESLKSEKNEKGAILESLGEGVIAVDEKGTVLYINFTACKMLGLVRKNTLDHPLRPEGEKSNAVLIEQCQTLLAQCQQTSSIMTSSLSFGKEKKTYIDLTAAPKAQGKGAIIVLQDKTSHYRVLEMGKDFIANASHELRTPITIIKGYAETLQEIPNISPQLLSQITEKISRNCLRMENLVSDLLTLADLENLPESRFQPCDLMVLVDNCLHTLLSVHPEAQVEIVSPYEELLISADSGLLELAINNLLGNAAKYSKPPVQIVIKVDKSADEEEVTIEVSDNGYGIPAEDLDHIFEKFYRVDKAHSRQLGGTGLGLSIVKTIITQHDGTIDVTSQVGKGTSFLITLPVRIVS